MVLPSVAVLHHADPQAFGAGARLPQEHLSSPAVFCPRSQSDEVPGQQSLTTWLSRSREHPGALSRSKAWVPAMSLKVAPGAGCHALRGQTKQDRVRQAAGDITGVLGYVAISGVLLLWHPGSERLAWGMWHMQ